MPKKINGHPREFASGIRVSNTSSSVIGLCMVSLLVLSREIFVVSCKSTTTFICLIFFTSSSIYVLNPTSFCIKEPGKAQMAETATVETSMSAHIINQLACIKMPATRVFVMSDLISIFSLPIRFLIKVPNKNAISAKLAKFFMIFHIFQR